MDQLHLIETFIDYLKTNDRSSATIKSYASDLYLFAKWFEEKNHEELQAKKITPTDLRQYKQHLIDHPMKPSSINRKISVLKRFINWLLQINYIQQRFSFPKMLKHNNAIPRWLDKNQQDMMISHLEKYANKCDYAIIKLLLNTGLRVNELVELKWTHIRMTDKKGALTVYYHKTNHYRDIPLNKDARYALITLGFVKMSGKDEYVITGQRGQLTIRGVQLMIKRRFEYTDLCFITPHILRHTFCKNLVDADVSLEKIALLAGHESLNTTKLYCQPSFDDLSDLVDRIARKE
ncbi:tyrosine-type recombinase/integrase [Facilibium subflavum]|uniref:tyrosine-type recombinase/integrase n=1 Tax=Facilibium subflavum TaxID=2219058 RepID=UPI000E654C3D|nr:tyrosine-type recombinase/integrase [Facilibium subflavum]